MANAKPRVKVPKKAEAGEIVEIKTLISHRMESGLRKDGDGNVIPRQIINNFKAEFNGQPVFEAVLQPAISANPYITFRMKVPESGTVVFTWTDDDGSVYTAERTITVG